ncbi:hypothetical protein Hdeb2414_s0055g00756451 [Helianthus debilis subsp. tardiflorus]
MIRIRNTKNALQKAEEVLKTAIVITWVKWLWLWASWAPLKFFYTSKPSCHVATPLTKGGRDFLQLLIVGLLFHQVV